MFETTGVDHCDFCIGLKMGVVLAFYVGTANPIHSKVGITFVYAIVNVIALLSTSTLAYAGSERCLNRSRTLGNLSKLMESLRPTFYDKQT